MAKLVLKQSVKAHGPLVLSTNSKSYMESPAVLSDLTLSDLERSRSLRF